MENKSSFPRSNSLNTNSGYSLYSPNLARKLKTVFNNLLQGNVVSETKFKEYLKILNDKEIFNILSNPTNATETHVKELFKKIKNKYRNYENISNKNSIKKLITKMMQIDKKTKNINTFNKNTNNRTYDYDLRANRNILSGQIKATRKELKKSTNNATKQELSNKIKNLQIKVNKKRSILESKNTLELTDDDYKMFIQLIFRDMIHDNLLGSNTNEQKKYFREKIIPILIGENKQINVNLNMNKNVEIQARENIEKFKINYKNKSSKITLVPSDLGKLDNHVVDSPALEKLYVCLDSDENNILSETIKRFDKFVELKTPASIIDPGRTQLSTNILSRCYNIQRGQRGTGLCSIQTKNMYLNTKSLNFTIKSPNYETVFKLQYTANGIFILSVNDTIIPMGKPKGPAQTGNSNEKLSKTLGDLLQILYVMKLQSTKLNACFATFDKQAAAMYLFLQSKYSEHLKQQIKNKKKYNILNIKSKKLLDEKLEIYDPKLLFLQIEGSKISSGSSRRVIFINLKKYMDPAIMNAKRSQEQASRSPFIK